MAWGQIHSRPELCLGTSPLFLTFPDVLPWNDGWEAGKHHVYGVPLYILSCAPAILPAHKIHPAALSKCPNHFPFSTFTVPSPLSRDVGSPLPSCSLTYNGHVCLPRDKTLAKLEQGQCALEACCTFWPEVQNMRRLGAQRGRIGTSATMSHMYTTQTAPFLGGTGWYFGEVLAPRESYKLPTINRQLLDKCSNIQLTQFSHI